jgi:hypothetical protein
MSELIGTWIVAGTTDMVHTCERCGESLKTSVRLLCVGADEECLGEIYVGSTCAGKLLGVSVRCILEATRRANRVNYENECATWNEWNDRNYFVIANICELHFRGENVRSRAWCEYQETPEFHAEYSAWLDKNPEPIRPVAPR